MLLLIEFYRNDGHFQSIAACRDRYFFSLAEILAFCLVRSQCRRRFVWIWSQFEENKGDFGIDELIYKDCEGLQHKRQQKIFDDLEKRIRIKFKKSPKLTDVDFSDGNGRKTIDSVFAAIDKVRRFNFPSLCDPENIDGFRVSSLFNHHIHLERCCSAKLCLVFMVKDLQLTSNISSGF